ncbi:MAG: hypothetical protein KGL92_03280 [Gammaproteobacteria bacterium]|nr:hypothetical protein [Gammaproteobacteria bacterium]
MNAASQPGSRPDRNDTDCLAGNLVIAAEQLDWIDGLHAWQGADLIEHAERQRGLEEARMSMHDQQIGSYRVDCVFRTGFESLQHAEQRKGDPCLQEDQHGPPGLASDAGPDER